MAYCWHKSSPTVSRGTAQSSHNIMYSLTMSGNSQTPSEEPTKTPHSVQSKQPGSQTMQSLHIFDTLEMKFTHLSFPVDGVDPMHSAYETLYSASFAKKSRLQYDSPEGRPGMSGVSPLSGISGLSFDSTLLTPLLFFCLVLLPFLSYCFLPAGPFF